MNRYIKSSSLDLNDIVAYQDKGITTWDVSMSDYCNLGCSYCCVNCNVKDPSTGVTLSLDKINAAVKLITEIHLRNNFRNQTQVKLYGGEPLLNPNTLYMCEEIYKSFKRVCEPENNLRIVVITNGTLLNDDFIDRIKQLRDKMGKCLSLNISVDGYKENHNTYRTFKNGDPTFDIIIKNISKFYKTKYANMVMTQGVMTPDFLQNCDKVFEFAREQSELGLKAFGILPMNDTTFENYSSDEIVSIFKKFHKNILKNIDLVQDGHFLVFQFARALGSLLSRDDTIGKQFCHAGSDILHVMSNGEILPCHTFGYNNCDYMSFGNVLDEDIITKISHKRDKWIKIASVHTQCDSCKYGMISGKGCIGGCLGHNWINSRSNTIPDYVCVYNRCILDIAIDLLNKYPRIFRNYLTFKDKSFRYKLILLGDEV